jgi:alkylation response protein AidB-like acyl-CoA dehydrogenase
MTFTLNEEQKLLKDAARDFCSEQAPVSRLRKGRDEKKNGRDPELWREIAQMGWAGIIVPEEYGGAGLGYVGLGAVLEETGRTLAPSPLLSTAMIGASALMLGGSDALRAEWLPKIASGEVVVAFALDEGAHHAPAKTTLKAEKAAEGYKISGEKKYVADGHIADLLVVAARFPNGQVGPAFVKANAPGVTRRELITADSRGAADITLDGVDILPWGAKNTEGVDILPWAIKTTEGGVDILPWKATTTEGGVDILPWKVATKEGVDILPWAKTGGVDILPWAVINQILDRARIGLAAEVLGQAQAAFEITSEYLKTRKQFGQVIGAFQSLQHRAAKMFTELELTRSCVYAALDALDRNAENVAEYASLAKARAGETLHLVSNECVQMHGGIGMTDEHDAGLYLKRARVAEALYGGASFHRDRYASLLGF